MPPTVYGTICILLPAAKQLTDRVHHPSMADAELRLMNMSYSDKVSAEVFCSLNAVSVLVCLLAAILVFVLKLYSKFVYRLALYQVLASLIFATLETLEIFSVYLSGPLDHLCYALAYTIVFSQWMKLLFTAFVALHLFCFAVLYKNLKRLEALYVVVSIAVPAVIAAVPLVTKTYGNSPLGCYIYYTGNSTAHISFMERFLLWDAPAMVILLVASVAMAVVVTKYTLALTCRCRYQPIVDGDQYWKALTQLLPLAAFPTLFFLFLLPEFVYNFSSELSSLGDGTKLSAAVFISLWGLSSGAMVIIHITVVRFCRRKKHSSSSAVQSGHKPSGLRNSILRAKLNSYSHVHSTTHYSPPNDA